MKRKTRREFLKTVGSASPVFVVTLSSVTAQDSSNIEWAETREFCSTTYKSPGTQNEHHFTSEAAAQEHQETAESTASDPYTTNEMFEAGAVADPQPPADAPKFFENPEGCAIWTRGSISSVVVEGPKNQHGVIQY